MRASCPAGAIPSKNQAPSVTGKVEVVPTKKINHDDTKAQSRHEEEIFVNAFALRG
jgi:hypothetical protein